MDDTPAAQPDPLQTAIDRLGGLRGVALLEGICRVIDVAEEAANGEAAAEWRLHLIQAASHFGRLDYELRGLQGLRQQYESDPAFVDLRPQILWYYKWVGERLADHVELSAEAIVKTLDDMEAFYRSERENLRPVHGLRRWNAIMMGRNDEADRHDAAWHATPEGQSDNCPACETNDRVIYLLMTHRVDEAIEAAEPIITGEQQCEEVPVVTFGRLFIPFLSRGQAEVADAMHRATVRQARQVPKLLGVLAQHIVFLSLTGRPAAANRLAFVALARAMESTNSYHRFVTLRAGGLWLGMLARQGVASVALPRAFHPEGGPASVPAAAVRCLDGAHELAAAFDARNGNDLYGTSVNFIEGLLRTPMDGEG